MGWGPFPSSNLSRFSVGFGSLFVSFVTEIGQKLTKNRLEVDPLQGIVCVCHSCGTRVCAHPCQDSLAPHTHTGMSHTPRAIPPLLLSVPDLSRERRGLQTSPEQLMATKDKKTKKSLNFRPQEARELLGRWDKNSNTLKQKLHTSGVCLREHKHSPDPPTLAFFFEGKKQGNPEKSKGFSLPGTPKILGKEKINGPKNKTEKARKKKKKKKKNFNFRNSRP